VSVLTSMTTAVTAALTIAGGVAAANTFADEDIELGSNAGIKRQLPPAPLAKSIHAQPLSRFKVVDQRMTALALP
jgi:hypothetical protein